MLPRGTMRDIVTSLLPFWDNTRLWVIARPLSGFAETFSQYIVEVSPGGGSDKPELDPHAEGVVFVVEGTVKLTIDAEQYTLWTPAATPICRPGPTWTLHNQGAEPARFHWVRKAYEAVEGLDTPPAFVTYERDEVEAIPMPGTDGRWATHRFADPERRAARHARQHRHLQPGAASRSPRPTSWSTGSTSCRARPSTG